MIEFANINEKDLLLETLTFEEVEGLVMQE